MARKTFHEKLADKKDMPVIKPVTDPGTIARYGGDRMLFAPPVDYDKIIRAVPRGKLITAEQIRAYLAAVYGADFTCPLTAGIFISLVAQASNERGADETPYWRALKKDGELNAKYPGGVEDQRRRLEEEGHKVFQRGKRFFVESYEDSLVDLEAVSPAL